MPGPTLMYARVPHRRKGLSGPPPPQASPMGEQTGTLRETRLSPPLDTDVSAPPSAKTSLWIRTTRRSPSLHPIAPNIW